jgi:hypothetical protein
MNIQRLEKAIRTVCKKTRIEKIISVMGYIYSDTYRLETTRGGHLLVKTLKRPYTDEEFLRSICRVRDKYETASLMVNGQAYRNASDVAWFHEGHGPRL